MDQTYITTTLDDGSTIIDMYAEIERRGWRCYSGEDGDLFRKHNLPGWRVSLYGASDGFIQQHQQSLSGKKGWYTVASFEDDPRGLLEAVDALVREAA